MVVVMVEVALWWWCMMMLSDNGDRVCRGNVNGTLDGAKQQVLHVGREGEGRKRVSKVRVKG